MGGELLLQILYASLPTANLERTEDQTISAKPIVTVRPALWNPGLVLGDVFFFPNIFMRVCGANAGGRRLSYIFQGNFSADQPKLQANGKRN